MELSRSTTQSFERVPYSAGSTKDKKFRKRAPVKLIFGKPSSVG